MNNGYKRISLFFFDTIRQPIIRYNEIPYFFIITHYTFKQKYKITFIIWFIILVYTKECKVLRLHFLTPHQTHDTRKRLIGLIALLLYWFKIKYRTPTA